MDIWILYVYRWDTLEEVFAFETKEGANTRMDELVKSAKESGCEHYYDYSTEEVKLEK